MAELTPEKNAPPNDPTEAAEPQTARILVVIVSFNRAELLRLSLEALGPSLPIVVVDNGSVDGSPAVAESFPHVRLMRLPKNFGLTKALNIGLRAVEADHILCLHDDVRIPAEAVTRLADFLEARQDVGAVAPILIDEEGTPVPQIRRLPSPSDPDPALHPATSSSASAPDAAAEIPAECVTGAAIMFRSFFLRATRQLDERYGTYGSDIEICAQMRRAGKKVVVLPAAAAVHFQAADIAPDSALAGDRAAGTAVFLAKYHGFATGLLYRIKTALGALFTLRFSVFNGAASGRKIDGT